MLPNPTGKNKYKECPAQDDARVETALREYHRRNITDKYMISKLLLSEHGIKMSASTVTRRRKALSLKGSGSMTRELPDSEKRQLVLDQMAKHPARGMGPRRMKEVIAADTGIHLTRDYISDEMHKIDPDGFQLRHPTSKKKFRLPLVSLGPDHEWSCDGHDKLSTIGFPVWGIRDVWSGKWLGLWVVPNNRLKIVTAYLYLRLVHDVGGMPIQTTTDRGSETGSVYGFANALREAFSPDLPIAELPAHRFLPSIENITIERGWLRLRLEWGDDVRIFWDAGYDLYNSADPDHRELCQWLWPKLIQQELDKLRDKLNNHKPRRDHTKLNPTGVAPNVAYALCHEYGGERCLQPVDKALIAQLMEELGGESLIRFVSADYSERAEHVYGTLAVQDLSFHNVWDVFTQMLPRMIV
ncbi:hypothetical protein PYCCODRAFT_1443303 [Trametes coccinea BRFM310]|uniref:Integrase catalytic domain-containing protein n=1 Tax=Trametes coccinea (strain BRFM310) TaxID=1353009 RepID=A0A1Y2IYV9_TRAC3|nr:hypothetical protein PYCCODRAFT_1443303 [Trametes coccinea BRFM310]